MQCDGDRPICQKCRKSNRVCSGTSTGQIGSVVHIENTYASGQSKRPRGPRSNPAAHLTSKLNLDLRSPTIDLKSQAIAYYLHHHLRTMQDIPSISKSVSGDVLPIWTQKAEWPILDLAVSSLALAVFSRIRQHPPAAIEASKNYDRLLQMFQVNILSLDAQNVDAYLLAIFLMSRYEEAIHQSGHPNLRTTFNKSLRSFSHHDGALAILKLWSQQLNHSQPATNVIKHTRRGLIRSFLLMNFTVA